MKQSIWFKWNAAFAIVNIGYSLIFAHLGVFVVGIANLLVAVMLYNPNRGN